MRRTALLLAWLAIVSPLRAAEEDDKTREATPAESQNPILSLLLLPANLLARIAAFVSSEPPKAQRPAKAGSATN